MSQTQAAHPAKHQQPDNRERSARGRGLKTFAWAAAALAACGWWLYYSADATLVSTLSARQVVDVTQLERTQVARVVTPRTTAEVAELLKSTRGPVSIGGARASMGGQIAEPGSVHLDMRQMNGVVAFAPERREITVQAGITWRDIQDVIDPHDLSVQIMQTYANFTVGGALSVNAHGRYMGRGPVVQSVRSIQLVLANGEVVQASPGHRAELFFGAIGGYGGLGVITEVTLALDLNQKIKRTTRVVPTAEYAAFFRENVRADKGVIFHNADLRPPAFETARAVSWVETNDPLTIEERLIPRDDTYTWTPRVINNLIDVPFGNWLREWIVEPWVFTAEEVTWRNHEASYDIAELEPPDRKEVTYVLREYFVPAERFDDFVPRMRDVFAKHDVEVINVSVRHASPDPGTLLGWARGETFAFVVYYQQRTTPEAIVKVGEWSREMVDAVLAVGGTYYLPYQNHATREQFLAAYPRAPEYFELKRRVDPELRFQNHLWYHYGPSPRAESDDRLDKLGYDRKPEAQTLLTIPEWYLVFNPGEYVRHLRAGKPPDEFPFFESVREYWSLYKKVLAETEDVYPENGEYLTMLRVIGVSTTVEYIVKGVYEATIGRVTRSFSLDRPSAEQEIINDAFTAYEQLIYDEPWYEFDFLPWVMRIWRDTSWLGPDWLRRTERKLAFTAEFAVKGVYATALGLAAESAYGPVDERIQMLVLRSGASLPAQAVAHEGGSLPNGTEVVSVERWKEFSEVVPELARRGVDFVDIAGNDDIAVTVVQDRNDPWQAPVGQLLFTSRIVTDPARERAIWFVPVVQLGEFVRQIPAAHVDLEHVYDY